MINDKAFLMFEDGFFKPYFEKFIEYKRGKGEKVAQSTMARLRKLNFMLNRFDSDKITRSMVDEILAPREGLSEYERSYMVSSLRQFCAFLNTLGVKAVQVPPKYMKPVKCGFRPYIFSEDEERRLIYAADHLPACRRSNNHLLIYPALVRLLFGTGMRIGECLALKRGDIDLTNGIIRVINGKNGVSRYIPVSESLRQALADYSEHLDMDDPEKPFFPSSYTGDHLSYDAMKYMFPKMMKMAGIVKSDGKTPNIHSIRHTFCTRSLSQMLSNGMDIYTAVPILAAYVGHVNYCDTERYIHFTEQDYDEFITQESFLGTLIPEVDDE